MAPLVGAVVAARPRQIDDAAITVEALAHRPGALVGGRLRDGPRGAPRPVEQRDPRPHLGQRRLLPPGRDHRGVSVRGAERRRTSCGRRSRPATRCCSRRSGTRSVASSPWPTGPIGRSSSSRTPRTPTTRCSRRRFSTASFGPARPAIRRCRCFASSGAAPMRCRFPLCLSARRPDVGLIRERLGRPREPRARRSRADDERDDQRSAFLLTPGPATVSGCRAAR